MEVKTFDDIEYEYIPDEDSNDDGIDSNKTDTINIINSGTKTEVLAYGICSDRYRSSINDFLVKGRYDVVPAVFISDGNRAINYCYETPFKIFEKDMDLELVKNIVSQYENNINFLNDARNSYDKLTKIVNKNADKVIADIISTQIMLKIKENKDKNVELIFFISNLTSDKIIGRLGYLFLDYSNVTIAFITYNSKQLMTNVINKNYLDFDLTYSFDDNKESIIGSIDPDNNIQSMISTFFHKINLTIDSNIAPLRIDVFSQNLSYCEIINKIKIIKNYLNNSKNLAVPVVDRNADDYVVRLPKPLQQAIDAKENFSSMAEIIINRKRENDGNRKSV